VQRFENIVDEVECYPYLRSIHRGARRQHPCWRRSRKCLTNSCLQRSRYSTLTSSSRLWPIRH